MREREREAASYCLMAHVEGASTCSGYKAMPFFRPWRRATELRGFGSNDTPSRVHERIAFHRSVFDYVHNRIRCTAGEVRKALVPLWSHHFPSSSPPSPASSGIPITAGRNASKTITTPSHEPPVCQAGSSCVTWRRVITRWCNKIHKEI